MPEVNLGNDDGEEIEGFFIPDDISITNRGVRLAIGGTGKLVGTILATYAAYQASAHDTLDLGMMQSILEKSGAGITETIIDIKTAALSLYENSGSIARSIGPEFIWGEPSFEDASDITDSIAHAYGQTQIDTAKATNNFFNSPIETISSTILTGTSLKWLSNLLINTAVLTDRADLGQKTRSILMNLFRSKKGSRKLKIPRKGGNTFTRL